MPTLKDTDRLIELIDDDIASLDKDMPREGYDACLCTLEMVKQYIKALPTVPRDWKSILDDWTEHDNAMIAKGREIERRLNAPKHGHWIYIRDEENNGLYECSECHKRDIHAKECEVPYCWYCGARMDGGENG